MPVTLTDEQAAELRRRLEQGDRDKLVRESAEAIWNDPNLGDRAKAIWKEKFPDTRIEDYDLKREVFGRLDKEKQEREEAERKAKEEAAVERYRQQKADVQKRHGLTDDAMERMEKMMDERRVYDYEVAATHFVSREPKPIADAQRHHLWNHDRSQDFKDIAADPDKYAMDAFVQAINADEARRRNS